MFLQWFEAFLVFLHHLFSPKCPFEIQKYVKWLNWEAWWVPKITKIKANQIIQKPADLHHTWAPSLILPSDTVYVVRPIGDNRTIDIWKLHNDYILHRWETQWRCIPLVHIWGTQRLGHEYTSSKIAQNPSTYLAKIIENQMSDTIFKYFWNVFDSFSLTNSSVVIQNLHIHQYYSKYSKLI